MMLNRIIESAELSAGRFTFCLSSRFRGSPGGGKFGNKTGQSLEFVEHREYQPGDDIRHLDWSAVARSDKLAIKLFKEEITPHVDIFLDLSSSMSAFDVKFQALVALSAILKRTASNSGFSYDNWLVKDLCRKIEPNTLPVELWPAFSADYNDDSGKTICYRFPKVKRGGVRILISDLFWHIEPMSVLNRMADGSAFVIIVQLVAKSDILPDIYGNMRVIDSESGDALELVCDEQILSEYTANFERHRQYWKKCCSKVGAIFNFVVAEDILDNYIPDELIRNEVLMVKG